MSEEDAKRLGPRVGHIPLSVLREQTEGGSHFPAGEYAITTVSGEHLAHALSPVPRIILDTPYWPSVFRRLGARSRTGGYIATNLLYKIYRYGGEGRLLDSIWVPPPAWKQAKQPAMGDFLPGRPEEWSTYLDGISVIRALAVVGDSALVVCVGPYEGGGASFSLDPGGFLEVYIGNRMVGKDLRTPGWLVAYSDRSLFFLERSAHANGATLTEYTWGGGER